MNNSLNSEELRIFIQSKLFRKIDDIAQKSIVFMSQYKHESSYKYRKYIITCKLNTGSVTSGTCIFGIWRESFIFTKVLLKINYWHHCDGRNAFMECKVCEIDQKELSLIYTLLDSYKEDIEDRSVLNAEMSKVDKEDFAEKIDLLANYDE